MIQGLPKEWQRLISESGIPEKERRENPQTMVDILQFYKETTEKPAEDQVLEKFGHASPQERSQYTSPPASHSTSPTMYPANYMGKLCIDVVLAFVIIPNFGRMQEALKIPEPLLRFLPRAMECLWQRT